MGRGNSGAPLSWGDVMNGGRTGLRGVPGKITVYGRIRFTWCQRVISRDMRYHEPIHTAPRGSLL
jgi:hypothetical protein